MRDHNVMMRGRTNKSAPRTCVVLHRITHDCATLRRNVTEL